MRLLTLAALSALVALLAASLFTLAPAAADEHPDDIELVLSVDDSDGIVAPGSEFTVSAALRFTGPHTLWRRLNISDAALRLPGLLDWEATGRGALRPDDQTVMGHVLYRPDGADGEPVGWNRGVVALGLHSRTLLARSDDQELYIYDVWNKRQAAVITPPASANGGTFGRPNGQQDRHGAAVWHESDSTAWLFIGSNGDTISGTNNVGSLYIYKLDWSREPLSVELVQRIAPPQSEFSNARDTVNARYGTAVTVSADGGTLAVSAERINTFGAVYVYTRPDGPGQSWGELEYADGVKLTVAPTPAWGTSSTRPFDPAALNTCDAYCSRVSSMTQAGPGFGSFTVSLSDDGRVLAVGAANKSYPFDTPGGGFTGGTANVGEVYVFVAPDDGWQAAPAAGGTLIAAGEDASNFDPLTHHSPGPARRITAPTALLLARPWASAAASRWFGQETTVSADGSMVAASEGGNNRVHIFQRDSASDWSGELLPSAAIRGGNGYGAWGGIWFNREGNVLLIGNAGSGRFGTFSGRFDVYTRPASGVWADAAAQTAVQIFAPTPKERGTFSRHLVRDLAYERLAISHSFLGAGMFRNAYGGVFLSDSNCTVRIVDEVSTTTCPITIADSKVVIPAGTRDGVHTISGQVTLSVQGVADSEVVLRDAIEVTIGRVQELTEVNFDFATDGRGTTATADDRPFPAVLAAGETTTLRLQLLNENGKPSAAGAASSVRVYTNVGVLDSSVGCVRSGAATATCAINLDNLTGSNSGAIPITLTHGGTAGAAQVRASVISTSGEVFDPQAISVALTGPPASLSIAAPGGGLLNVGTPDSGADQDDRDVLTLAVSAQDKAGQTVALPTGGSQRATLTDPDGERVASGVELEWPLGGADRPTLNAAGQRQVRVNVNRAAAQPLANGEYTLEVRAGTLTATQTFSVSGGPAAITLSEPDGSLEQGGRFSLTATVVDADGAPVPDGTAVEWLSQGLGTTPGPVRLAAETKTTNGAASAEFLSILSGTVYVTAEAGGVKQLALLRISEPAGAVSGPRGPAADLSSTTPNSYAVWQGAAPVAASELYQALPPTVVTLSQAVVAGWKHYDGAAARDFTIPPGAVLWLSGR